VPRETVQLAFVTGGEVAEVLVEEGDVVKAGDVLARLGNQEGLEASIVAADLELLNAKQAVDKLQEQAEDAAIAAQRRIADFTRVIRDAQYQQDNFIVYKQAGLDPYEAVDLMEKNLDKAAGL
jgi:multidrug efflux pump subunit AcrA (membrane-fusion protein)